MARARVEPSVDELLVGIDHPLAAEIAGVRKIIVGADPAIAEGVKWNAPSFRTTEWFATVNLRSRDSLQVVMHLGAKVRDVGPVEIADPDGLLKWLGKDRALATLGSGKEFNARKAAFADIVRKWIRYV